MITLNKTSFFTFVLLLLIAASPIYSVQEQHVSNVISSSANAVFNSDLKQVFAVTVGAIAACSLYSLRPEVRGVFLKDQSGKKFKDVLRIEGFFLIQGVSTIALAGLAFYAFRK